MPIPMTGNITEAFVSQFAANFTLVSQRRESSIVKAVKTVPVRGEALSFDLMDAVELSPITERHPDTPLYDPAMQRRWINTTPFAQGILLDTPDKIALLKDPTSSYLQSLAMAANRKKEEVIITAAFATVQAGRNYGESTITWPNIKYPLTNGRTIAHDAVISGSPVSSGLTIEKLQMAREYFTLMNVPDDLPLNIAVNPAQVYRDLLSAVEVRSIDYNTVRALANGELTTFMGFKFHLTSKIVKGTSNDIDGDTDVYRCIVWAGDGLALGVSEEPYVSVSTRNDKNDAQQVYLRLQIGAVRTDEDKVLCIECI